MSVNMSEPQIMAGIEQDDRPDLGPVPAQPVAANKNISPATRSNLILVGLFLAGAATVAVLGLRKGPAMASASMQQAEAQVDSAILHLTDAAKPGAPASVAMTKELIDGFQRHDSRSQVPPDRLAKNPFLFIPPSNQMVETTPAAPQLTVREKTPEQVTFEKAQAEIKTLYLQSVMMGHDGGSAIIANNLVTVGQQIKCFTVVSITPKSVLLKWQDKDFTLSMQ